MNKRDYQMIADVISNILDSQKDSNVIEAIEDIVQNLANEFSDDNIQFNRQRFYTACGLDENGEAP